MTTSSQNAMAGAYKAFQNISGIQNPKYRMDKSTIGKGQRSICKKMKRTVELGKEKLREQHW
jgi:hypothetical protein